VADHLAASGHPYQIRTWARSRLRAGRWAAASSLLTLPAHEDVHPGGPRGHDRHLHGLAMSDVPARVVP
jgi:hypothetical protein